MENGIANNYWSPGVGLDFLWGDFSQRATCIVECTNSLHDPERKYQRPTKL